MAKQKVTGLTEDELPERRETYENRRRRRGDLDERPPFEDRFCLARIPNQPEDYDGPQRYCMKAADGSIYDRTLCKFHGSGRFKENPENLTPYTAAITHGMKAELQNLVKDFDEKDQALYDWITSDYADAYDLDIENDPSTAYNLHRFAAEAVRAERGRGFLIEEGEVHKKEVRNDEGRIVIDDDGNVVTEKSEHYLAKMLHRQDKKLTDLEKELGITRKERLKQDTADSAVESIKSLAELGNDLLGREEREYSGSDEPWNDE